MWKTSQFDLFFCCFQYIIKTKLNIGDDNMQVSKEEILHIANLANLTLEENEVQQYLDNLQEILDFANIVNNANTENLDITIGANEAKNVFRKDEVEVFKDNQALFMNAPSEEQNMFKIPKVIN